MLPDRDSHACHPAPGVAYPFLVTALAWSMRVLGRREPTLLALIFSASCFGPITHAATPRPNVLWISAEDISPHLGCYGDPHAITPHLDRLAAEGVRFTNAYTTAGVCAPCRSGIITGMHQTTLGTHHMRCRARLPEAVRLLPALLRQAGYYTSNNSKEDYQFETPQDAWDESSPSAHWRRRPNAEQPFFAVFNFTGCHESGIASAEKYRSVTADLRPSQRQDAARMTTLPPYYPDTPAAREDWKRYYELITALDAWAGDLLAQLEQDGLADDTIVMFWSDHGVGLPRAKRWLYDSGVRVPLVVRIPPEHRSGGHWRPGGVSDDLVSSIDFAPTVLSLAGVEAPETMQGQAFLGSQSAGPREYVYGARDRMDERYDAIRMVRDKRFKYLRNYAPWEPYFQHISTAEKGTTMKELRRLRRYGALPPAAEKYFTPSKPVEELYDVEADPHELTNLAGDPRFARVLARLRKEQRDWSIRTRDVGLIPEPILAELENRGENLANVFRGSEGEHLARRLASVAGQAPDSSVSTDALRDACRDPHAAVRYWAITRLSVSGQTASVETATTLLSDDSTAVRIAAAKALCRAGRLDDGLPVLTKALRDGGQWERLLAVNVLDELDGDARDAVPALRSALRPRRELFAEGKYTVRVANRALSDLNAADKAIP